MLRRITVLVLLGSAAYGAAVIDRIAAIVGKHVVKLSDIDRDLRVTAFLNRQTLVENAETRRKAAERLIDQQIIRDELANGGYSRPADADAEAMLRQIRQTRFGGIEVRMKQALTQYGLVEEELRANLLWQLTVLRFIEQRFQPGVMVTDDQVRAYYDQHPEVRKAPFAAATPEIRKMLEGEQVNTQFEAWLADARKDLRVEFREGAFQ
jgi:hypothetical protein